jgi:hypothetical protein
MTPKQKAKELVNNFYQPLGYLKCGVNNTKMWQHAKEYALIAVDEILILITAIDGTEQWQEYYEQVKNEIERL